MEVLPYLGVLNISLIVCSLLALFLFGKEVDLRKKPLSTYGIRKKSARFFGGALIVFGLTHLIYFSYLALKLGQQTNIWIIISLVMIIISPIATSLITMKKNFLVHSFFASSGIIFISFCAVVLSWFLVASNQLLGTIGLLLPLIIIFGLGWAMIKKYPVGGMVEFFFVVCLICWNLIFTVSNIR